ncbi:hypothetical protein WCE37_14700 [Luteimonas sp. MJ250]|uniref:hypothetical protein n=1 Tax=Luteimonas sp. MJ250 TaxID=3129236 RepID=UPI0031BA35A1
MEDVEENVVALSQISRLAFIQRLALTPEPVRVCGQSPMTQRRLREALRLLSNVFQHLEFTINASAIKLTPVLGSGQQERGSASN